VETYVAFVVPKSTRGTRPTSPVPLSAPDRNMKAYRKRSRKHPLIPDLGMIFCRAKIKYFRVIRRVN
jgi:hypothetical protein